MKNSREKCKKIWEKVVLQSGRNMLTLYFLFQASGRHLVRIRRTRARREDEAVPRFRIMSDVDLEIAARKTREANVVLGDAADKTVLETEEGGRVKQKQARTQLGVRVFFLQLANLGGWPWWRF